jgi:hypothetical protein
MKRKLFTLQEINFLKSNYSDKNTQWIADQLNRPISSIYNKAASIGLKKSAEYLNSPECGRLKKGNQVGKKSQFKKGQKPFNKGQKQTDYMSPEAIVKTIATRFNKGNTPHNTKYDGYESVIGGYVYVRISKGVKVLKQRMLWEKVNGSIPKNGNIIFKDGNPLNFDMNNLDLLTHSELMTLNSIHRYPEEVKKSIRLISKLNSKIIDHGK